MHDRRKDRNNILSHLSASDFCLLAEHLELYQCAFQETLIRADSEIPYVYFPESGVISIVARSAEGQQAEVGIVGREGFLHPAVILGSDRIPHDANVQVAGEAYRIALRPFMAAVEDSVSLRQVLMLFAQVLTIQCTCTIMSNAVQQTEQRLARWLLMFHDRCESGSFSLTHDFIASMLSVRRPSITNALHVLEGMRLIRSERGLVAIRDRDAIESYVGSAYGKPEAEYSRLLWPM